MINSDGQSASKSASAGNTTLRFEVQGVAQWREKGEARIQHAGFLAEFLRLLEDRRPLT